MNLLTKIIVANIFFSYTLVTSETSLLLAKLNLEKVEKDYTEAYEKCINLEKDNIISPNDIKNIKLYKKEWISILYVLSKKSLDICTQKENGIYLSELNTYISIGNHYKKD